MRLRYTRRAAEELDQVLSYIGRRSPEGAHHVRARIRAVIDLIASHPQSGQLTSMADLRRVVVHRYPYLIFYYARDDEIVIQGGASRVTRPVPDPGMTDVELST